MYLKSSILLCVFFLYVVSFNAQPATEDRSVWGTWDKWGAQSDGSYCNPILPADFSDLDCIRVGSDYYAISSTFQYAPGMVVLHSTDLVQWSIIGHAVEDIRQIGPELNWDRMDRYGRGIWAGSIRYHNGRFYVLFGTPDEGFFTTWAEHPSGPWAPLTNILSEAGWDDCSAIWDSDGQAWFVGTLFRDRRYETYLFKMTSDCSAIDREQALLLHHGGGREASKLIQVGAWYYLIYSRTGGGSRYMVARRAKHMRGPWSEEKQITALNIASNQPNQGGMVEGPSGQWYFFTHHGKGDWEGRAASLLPVTWIDGWPIPGKLQADGLGCMQWSAKMPLAGIIKNHNFFDDFDGPRLDANWEWNYYPYHAKWSLQARKGFLRLHAVRPLKDNDFKKIPNILTQRVYRIPHNEVTIKLDVRKMATGQVAGLCHYAQSYAYVGVLYEEGRYRILFNNHGTTEVRPIDATADIWLRSTWSMDGLSCFTYSTDGIHFYAIGTPYQFTWGHYRGTRVGIFTHHLAEQGFVDVDYFKYNKE